MNKLHKIVKLQRYTNSWPNFGTECGHRSPFQSRLWRRPIRRIACDGSVNHPLTRAWKCVQYKLYNRRLPWSNGVQSY